MAKKYVDKKTVLKAIKTEPLTSGEFVQQIRDPYGFYVGGINENPNCKVCAVGAVLRNAGLDNRRIELFGETMRAIAPVHHQDMGHDVENSIKVLLTEKRFLHALSVKFEYTAAKLGCGKKTRKVLEAFVNENFPNKILLSARY